jgi:FkbM family methyltransferase
MSLEIPAPQPFKSASPLAPVLAPFLRLRVFFRAARAFGFAGAGRLAWLRFRPEQVAQFRIPGLDHPVALRSGGSSDMTALYQLFVTNEYRDVSNLVNPSLIVDGGANIGLATLYFLRRYPSVRVVAVEPDPENFELCQRNLAPYADRVVLIKGAVWSSSCRLVLVPSAEEWSAQVRPARDGEAAAIDAFDIASLISMGGGGPVDLLKLDIEGSEADLFRDGPPAWLPMVRNIAIELHSPQCTELFFGALQHYSGDVSVHDSTIACLNLRPQSLTL